MRFVASLKYVTGYIRDAILVGELTKEEYAEWLLLNPQDQSENIWDVGNLKITSYAINDAGPVDMINWENNG